MRDFDPSKNVIIPLAVKSGNSWLILRDWFHFFSGSSLYGGYLCVIWYNLNIWYTLHRGNNITRYCRYFVPIHQASYFEHSSIMYISYTCVLWCRAWFVIYVANIGCGCLLIWIKKSVSNSGPDDGDVSCRRLRMLKCWILQGVCLYYALWTIFFNRFLYILDFEWSAEYIDLTKMCVFYFCVYTLFFTQKIARQNITFC